MYKPRVKAPSPQALDTIRSVLRTFDLNSVCEAAACPNRGECYARKSATFMILGDTCTRACGFCNVKTGKGKPPNPKEPHNLADAVAALDMRYVVLTSVDRDDLEDYGSNHFAACVSAIRRKNPTLKIELLTPDFKADTQALDIVIASKPHKLAHNQETVRRLSKKVRPQSDYNRSLEVLAYYASRSESVVKSSLMVGLGERENELLETMHDLKDAGVEEITIGQYLQPTPKHHPVHRYYDERFFADIRKEAYNIGFKAVASGILTRSSYFAERLS